MSGVDQLPGVLGINVQTLALSEWSKFAAHVRPLIPVEPKPAHGGNQPCLMFWFGAGLIRVFDAQNELATMASGESQIKQSDVGSTYMGCPCRGRGDANTNIGHGMNLGNVVEGKDDMKQPKIG